jgi:hypothetical protein
MHSRAPGQGTRLALSEVMAERLCANPGCHCEPGPDTIYCGSDCEWIVLQADADASTVPGCACGHPECHPDNVPVDQPDPIAQPTR